MKPWIEIGGDLNNIRESNLNRESNQQNNNTIYFLKKLQFLQIYILKLITHELVQVTLDTSSGKKLNSVPFPPMPTNISRAINSTLRYSSKCKGSSKGMLGWHLPSYQHSGLKFFSVLLVHILYPSVTTTENMAILVHGPVIVLGVCHSCFNGFLQVFTLDESFDKFLRMKG